jgi:hypothetical protein
MIKVIIKHIGMISMDILWILNFILYFGIIIYGIHIDDIITRIFIVIIGIGVEISMIVSLWNLITINKEYWKHIATKDDHSKVINFKKFKE